jgi:hypothetical protein
MALKKSYLSARKQSCCTLLFLLRICLNPGLAGMWPGTFKKRHEGRLIEKGQIRLESVSYSNEGTEEPTKGKMYASDTAMPVGELSGGRLFEFVTTQVPPT